MLAPHVEHLYRLAFRFSRSRFDAEDLVQELLIKLYPRQERLHEIKSLRPWLMRSLYNLYIDSYRRNERSPVEHGHDETMTLIASPDRGPAQDMEHRDLQKRLIKAMEVLNEDQRILLIMHDIESYTLAEIADILETPVGTLKSRLHRSRARLKKLLEEGTSLFNEAC